MSKSECSMSFHFTMNHSTLNFIKFFASSKSYTGKILQSMLLLGILKTHTIRLPMFWIRLKWCTIFCILSKLDTSILITNFNEISRKFCVCLIINFDMYCTPMEYIMVLCVCLTHVDPSIGLYLCYPSRGHNYKLILIRNK